MNANIEGEVRYVVFKVVYQFIAGHASKDGVPLAKHLELVFVRVNESSTKSLISFGNREHKQLYMHSHPLAKGMGLLIVSISAQQYR